MENQHRKIKGYRELSQDEIDLMNVIKEKGAELGELLDRMEQNETSLNIEFGTGDYESRRWMNEGKMKLQLGLMCLVRAVAKPEFF